MENIITSIIGILLVVLSVFWFIYERKKINSERKSSDYIKMSFTVKFVFGAFILLVVGIKLIYDSFF